jgi:hypothetical protein
MRTVSPNHSITEPTVPPVKGVTRSNTPLSKVEKRGVKTQVADKAVTQR